MANIKKGQTYQDLGFRVDGKGIATDLTTGKSLSRAEVDKRLAGTGVSNIAKTHGGVAGMADRNPWLRTAAPIVAGAVTGNPILAAGVMGASKKGGNVGDYFKNAGIAAGIGALGQGLGKLPGIGIPDLGKVGSSVKDFLTDTLAGKGLPGISPAGGGGMPSWMGPLLTAGQGINAAQLMGKSLDYAKNAEGTAMSNWNANAPLREAGRAGMLNPKSSVDTSALPGIRSANPFARGAK